MSTEGNGKKKAVVFAAAAAFVMACVVGVVLTLFPFWESEGKEPDRIIRIDNMISNLGSEAAVKLSITVVLAPGEGSPAEEDGIRDAVISRLRTIEKPELDGIEGMDFLRSSLLSGTKAALGEDKVKEILIREFVVQ